MKDRSLQRHHQAGWDLGGGQSGDCLACQGNRRQRRPKHPPMWLLILLPLAQRFLPLDVLQLAPQATQQGSHLALASLPGLGVVLRKGRSPSRPSPKCCNRSRVMKPCSESART